MDSHYTIRPTEDHDLPYLPGVERAANTLFAQVGWKGEGHVMNEDDHRAYVQTGRSWVAVDENGHPVGFALASVVDDFAHLDEIDVHPDHGRRGIGRALVAQVCAWAQESGYPAITLTTERTIPWNAPFYAQLGFEIVPPDAWNEALHYLFEHEAGIGLSSDDRVLMKKLLGDES